MKTKALSFWQRTAQAVGVGATLTALTTRNAPAQEAASGEPQSVTVSVRDARTGYPIPARITITDTNDALVKFQRSKRSGEVALRRGVVYTRGMPTALELPAGNYNLYATRGMEWSRTAKQMTGRGTQAG